MGYEEKISKSDCSVDTNFRKVVTLEVVKAVVWSTLKSSMGPSL
jgi:hypothetical protein